jgi:putative endonuclease
MGRPTTSDDDGYTVYLARCSDGTLYTGIANDLWARVAAHDAGRGARYTRGRGPIEVRFIETALGKGEALSLEARIKRLSRREKRVIAHLEE